jgi:hypothetical protein
LEAEVRPAVDDSGSEELAELGDQGVESSLGVRGELVGPEGFDEFVAAGEAMTVEDQIGEEVPALASGEAAIEAGVVPFDDGRPAKLDPGWWRRRQGHANILSIAWA